MPKMQKMLLHKMPIVDSDIAEVVNWILLLSK